jgi:hypothetical protein
MSDMSAKSYVDQALDEYRGTELQAILIGYDLWDEFLVETGLSDSVIGEDPEVIYRDVSCRRSATPDKVNLLLGQ